MHLKPVNQFIFIFPLESMFAVLAFSYSFCYRNNCSMVFDFVILFHICFYSRIKVDCRSSSQIDFYSVFHFNISNMFSVNYFAQLIKTYFISFSYFNLIIRNQISNCLQSVFLKSYDIDFIYLYYFSCFDILYFQSLYFDEIPSQRLAISDNFF